jgi:gas vesicle protein
MRTFGASPSVRQPQYPMYLMGRGLGIAASQVVGASAPVAAAGATIGAGAAASAGLIAGSVVPIIGSAVGAIIGIVAGLLAAHAQRAAAAKNENAAADSASETFDQIIQQLMQAYNSGQASVADCMSALQQTQATMLQTLQSKVGPPGTAWTKNPPTGGAGTPCNSGCTVGCCVYYNDLMPGIVMFSQALSALGGPLASAQQVAAGMPAFGNMPATASGSGGICTSFTFPIEAIAKSKYSDYTRPAYQVTLTQPAVSSVASSVESLVGGGVGTTSEEGSLLPLLAIAALAFIL